MEFTWTEDEERDWQLEVNGQYFGMVCPHRDRFIYPVAVWGNDESECADTVDEAKTILVNAARNREYEDEDESRPYPECC